MARLGRSQPTNVVYSDNLLDFAQTPVDGDVGAGVDGNEVIQVSDAEAGAGLETELLAAQVVDTEGGSVVDGAEAVALPDIDSGSGADAQSINATSSDAESSSGLDAEVVVGPLDADVGSGVDAEVSIAANLVDTEASVFQEPNVEGVALVDAEAGSATETEHTDTVFTDNESAVGVDAGESISFASVETASALDANEKLLPVEADAASAVDQYIEVGPVDTEPITVTEAEGNIVLADSDPAVGTDANEKLLFSDTEAAAVGIDSEREVGPVEVEVGTADDAGEHLDFSFFDADTGAADDSGEVVGPSNNEGSFTADEALLIELADTEPATGVDAEVLVAQVITDTEVGAGVDAGEVIGLVEAEVGVEVDSTAISATLSGSETSTGLDAELISVVDSEVGTDAESDGSVLISDAIDNDNGFSVDAEASLLVSVSDSEAPTATDGNELLVFSDAEVGSAVDAGELANATIADVEFPNILDANESIAASFAEADLGSGLDSEIVEVSDDEVGISTDAELMVALFDAELVSAIEAVFGNPAVPDIFDAESSAALDAELPLQPLESEGGVALDGGENIVAPFADVDLGTSIDNQQAIDLPQSETVTIVEGGELVALLDTADVATSTETALISVVSNEAVTVLDQDVEVAPLASEVGVATDFTVHPYTASASIESVAAPTDAVHVVVIRVRSASEVVPVPQLVVARQLVIHRFLVENTPLLEQVKRKLTLHRGLGEIIPAPGDDPALLLSRVVSETIPTPVDVATRMRIKSRSVSEVLSGNNAGMVHRTYTGFRDLSEHLTTTDSSHRTVRAVRNLGEALSVSDAVTARSILRRSTVEQVLAPVDGAAATSTIVPSPINPPLIVVALSGTRLSRVRHNDEITVTLTFGQPVQAWVVRVGGTNPFDGELADSWVANGSGPVSSATAHVKAERLLHGANLVHVYAQTTDGRWSGPRGGGG